MVAVGMVLTWFGYTLSSWGYILVQGYDVKLSAWANPMTPYAGAWPPAKLPATVLLPGGTAASSGNTTATANVTGGGAAPATTTPATSGAGKVTLE